VLQQQYNSERQQLCQPEIVRKLRAQDSPLKTAGEQRKHNFSPQVFEEIVEEMGERAESSGGARSTQNDEVKESCEVEDESARLLYQQWLTKQDFARQPLQNPYN